MLHLNNIFKTFQQTLAVKNFNLSIKSGQLTVLIGPSGCGKSTVLKIIMGLIYPDSGTVLLDSKKVEPKSVLSLRREMGYVIQEGGLFPHLTARKNITLVAEQIGWKIREINRRLEELQELTHITPDILNRFPVQLSGGQRQRISLMRALMLDPNILLLDEPLGALDPMIRSELQKDLKEIFQKLSKTVLLVTHDMGEAAFFGDQIVLMREGEIIQNGQLVDLIKKPADPFVALFIRAQRNPINDYFQE
jgi:osmoprotectant transport system ATP-binding protein